MIKIIQMKTNYLLPYRFKKIGWMLLIPSFLLGLYTVISDWQPSFFDVTVPGIFIDEIFGIKKFMGLVENNVLNELLGILFILGGIFVAFSKEKDEDELISSIRLQSLVWATYWNYGILILAFIFLYDLSFFWIMIFNMFTILIFFIVKFNWSLAKLRKSVLYEE